MSLVPALLLVDDTLNGVFDLQQSVQDMGFHPTYLTHCVDEAQEIITSHKPAIIICDLFANNQRKGLDLVRKFPAYSRQFIIVTSCHDDSFYESANGLGVGGYLVKPFHSVTLRSVMDQAMRGLPPAPVNTVSYLFIRGAQNQRIRIEFNDISYIYSERNYIFIKTRESRFTLKRSLTKMMAELDDRFIRVHNSYIININLLKNVLGN